MAARRAVLSDPDPAQWRSVGPQLHADGVFVLTGASRAEIDDIIALHLAPAGANGWTVVREEAGVVRPDPVHGHEHFAYADGVSQPGVRGTTPDGAILTPSVDLDERSDQGALGQDLLWPGELVLGYPGQDPQWAIPTRTSAGPAPWWRRPSRSWTRAPSWCSAGWRSRSRSSTPPYGCRPSRRPASTRCPRSCSAPTSSGGGRAGPRSSSPRSRSTCRSARAPLGRTTSSSATIGWGALPLGRHVLQGLPPRRRASRRRTRPSGKDVAAAEAGTQTHRMPRRGISFGPELSHAEALSGHTTQQRGLLFLCYVGSIARQFEFVQQAWVDAPDFPQVGSGVDPIMGQPHTGTLPFLGAAPFSEDPANKPQLDVAHFVTMEGRGLLLRRGPGRDPGPLSRSGPAPRGMAPVRGRGLRELSAAGLVARASRAVRRTSVRSTPRPPPGAGRRARRCGR